MTEIAMPRLSDSMEEGTILKWLIADGQSVAVGQELVEIETDKATITHAAEVAGTLEILASEGATLPVGAPIARVGAGAGTIPQAPQPEPARPEPIAPSEAAPATGGAPAGNGAAPGAPAAMPVTAGVAAKATPLARRTARLHAVELERVPGSGPRGRIPREDVLRFAGAEMPPPASAPGRRRETAPAKSPAARAVDPAPPSDTAESAKGERRRVEPSRAQQLVARRMAESKATIPHFQVQTEVAMDAALALRAGLKASANGAGVPSINDFIVKACATAWRRHPRANGSYTDGGFDLHRRINIGVAVAADETLIVPVIADADTKSLGGIARESRRLADRVRAGEITPPEVSGATFTVSNLGMHGMTAITPV